MLTKISNSSDFINRFNVQLFISGQCRGIFPSMRTHSSDTLCSMDSLSDDGHIEINIPSPIPVTITAPEDSEPQKNGNLKNLHQTLDIEVT